MIYDEATPRAVIEALVPDVLVKGADWELDEIVGRARWRRRAAGSFAWSFFRAAPPPASSSRIAPLTP